MKHKRLAGSVGFCVAFIVVASPAWAEVMDKEPSVGAIWGIGLLFGCIGLLAVRYYPWSGMGTLLLSSVAFGEIFTEIYDPYIGPAIRHEAGNAYILSAYGAVGLVVTLHLAGFLWRGRNRKGSVARPVMSADSE
jgi:hypothetical protein